MKSNYREILETKICQLCDKPFEVTQFQGRSVFCSDECRFIAKRIKTPIPIFKIFVRDTFRCVYCGKCSFEDKIKLSIDHLYPQSKNGKSDLFNLVTCCEECNARKMNLILPKEQIINIWHNIEKRNKQSFLPERYSDLKKYFEKRCEGILK